MRARGCMCSPAQTSPASPHGGQSPPWLDRVRRHPRSPVNHQLQRLSSTKCCPTVSPSRIFSLFLSYNEMTLFLFRKYFDILGTAEIKTSPMWAAILTYFHLFYNRAAISQPFPCFGTVAHNWGRPFDHIECYSCPLIVLQFPYTKPTWIHIFSVPERFCRGSHSLYILLSSVLHILRW